MYLAFADRFTLKLFFVHFHQQKNSLSLNKPTMSQPLRKENDLWRDFSVFQRVVFPHEILHKGLSYIALMYIGQDDYLDCIQQACQLLHDPLFFGLFDDFQKKYIQIVVYLYTELMSMELVRAGYHPMQNLKENMVEILCSNVTYKIPWQISHRLSVSF